MSRVPKLRATFWELGGNTVFLMYIYMYVYAVCSSFGSRLGSPHLRKLSCGDWQRKYILRDLKDIEGIMQLLSRPL